MFKPSRGNTVVDNVRFIKLNGSRGSSNKRSVINIRLFEFPSKHLINNFSPML